MHQLALDMTLPPSHAREDLARSPVNAALLDHLEAAPTLHGAGLLIWGGPGSGKTHLARVWAHLHGAIWLPPESIGQDSADALLQGRALAAIDEIHRVRHWPGLVTLMNELRARGGQILVTAMESPAQHPVSLPDAQSRLMGLVRMAIPAPDDALLEALLRKRFSDWHWQVEPATLDYLLPRLPRSHEALSRWLARLRQQMERTPQRLTIPILRESLMTENG